MNNNLYTDDAYENDYAQANCSELHARIEYLEKLVRKLSGRVNDIEDTKKKHKKRIKALEEADEQIIHILRTLYIQLQNGVSKQDPGLLQGTFVKCIPNFIDMGTAVLKNVTKKHP